MPPVLRPSDLLIVETPGPACLRCAGLDDLEFLPAGDARLTRRVKANSTRYAVVARFSRTRAVTNDRACWSSRGPLRMRGDRASIICALSNTIGISIT
jgi:hypothetical protein